MPGFGSSSGASDTGPSEEVQEYYRLFGISEDATYDDVNEAYDALLPRYEDNPKMKIKLEVAKDKIFDDKLRKRMSGAIKPKVAESPWDRPEPKKPLIKLPPFLDEIMELPTRAVLLKNSLIFGAIAMLPILSKSWASSAVGIGFAVSIYTLYNRGVPESSNEMAAEMRPPKAKPLILAAGITFLAGAIGGTLSQLLFGGVRFIAQESVIALCTSVSFCISATLFKVQDES